MKKNPKKPVFSTCRKTPKKRQKTPKNCKKCQNSGFLGVKSWTNFGVLAQNRSKIDPKSDIFALFFTKNMADLQQKHQKNQKITKKNCFKTVPEPVSQIWYEKMTLFKRVKNLIFFPKPQKT